MSSMPGTQLFVGGYAVVTPEPELSFPWAYGWSIKSIDSLSLFIAFCTLSAVKRAEGWFAQHSVINFAMV